MGRDRLEIVLAILGWVGVVIFLGVTVIPGLGESKVFLATDWLVTNPPWSLLTPEEAVNRGVSDTVDSATPMLLLLTEVAQHGSFAGWDPFNAGGVGLGAFPNSAILSPLSLPWWILPAQAANAGVKVLEVVAIALGFQLLLRGRWRLPLFTVPLATIVFASSGFMVAWTNWPQTRVAACIPLLFWAIECLAIGGRWRHAVILGVVLASMLLGGFPAVTGYAVILGVAYFLVRSLAASTRLNDFARASLRSVAGGMLGVLLAAVHMLPFLWWTQHYVDFEARSQLVNDPLPLSAFASAASPFLLGPPDWSYGSWTIHFVEGFSYVGATTFVMLTAALLVRRRSSQPRGVVTFFAAAFLLLTIAMYFHGPVFDLFHGLPGISTSPIGRMRSVVGFVAAILVALGAAALYEPVSLRAEFRRLPRGVAGVLAIGCRVVLVAGISGVLVHATYSAYIMAPSIRSEHWILLTLILLAICALGALVVWIRPARITAAVVAVIVMAATTVPATYVAHRWWPLSDSTTFYPETDVHAELRERLGMNRYATVGWTMVPGTSSAYQLRSLTGHGFTSTQWHEVMSLIEPGFFQTATWSTIHAPTLENALTSPILDRFGVSYVVCSVNDCGEGTRAAHVIVDEESLSASILDDSVLIERESALDRVRWASSEIVAPDQQHRLEILNDPETSATAVVLEREQDFHDLSGFSTARVVARDIDTDTVEISLESDGPGWVVIADPMQNNGWNASLDGKSVELVPAEHAAVAVFVEAAGTHTITISYSAPYFALGLTISLLSLGALMLSYLFFVGSRFRERCGRETGADKDVVGGSERRMDPEATGEFLEGAR